jgi:hypothetical protein
MKSWGAWARVGVVGTLVLVTIFLVSGFINGDWAGAWAFFFLTFFWVAAWLLFAAIALGVSGFRLLIRRRIARPS